MSRDTFDPRRFNRSDNEPFDSILHKAVSRRSVLKSGAGFAALSLLSGFGLQGCSDDDNDDGEALPTLGFDSIAGAKLDAVVVPPGYVAQVLAPWGTPLNSLAADWKADGSNSSSDQANATGMHHDGMAFFPLNGSSTDGVLCINHEYIDQRALHPNGPTSDETSGLRTDVEEIRKEILAHGVSAVRVTLVGGTWKVVT
ncbi:MAG TPA: dTDP-glucose 4,6-dehydratase, partial [Gammaproteobacteria bacterium]|nr:dTDP-glucose 4,6-dehydratase [Gammaproteobacteria bacterium]